MALTKRQLGQAGEDLAQQYFLNLGHTILGRNFLYKTGEIDLVTQTGKFIYFVEIKWRQNNKYGRAIESVSRVKQGRIRRTAEYLLIKNPDWKKWIPFFSVLAMDEGPDGTEMEFVPDAFM